MDITCPHCNLKGKISEDKLKASAGNIRCPRCKKVFSPETVLDQKNEVEDITLEEGIVLEETDDQELKFLDDEEIGFVDELGSGSLSVGDELEDIDILTEDDLMGGMGDDVLGSVIEEPLELVEPLDEDDFDIEGKRKRRPKEKRRKKKEKKIKADKEGEDTSADVVKDAEVEGVTAPARTALGDKRARWRNILLVVLAIALLLYAWSVLYPPYAQEKEFLDDSQELLGEYRKLLTVIQKEIPNSVYLVKVAEMAYPYEVYVEKYGVERIDNPIYISLAVTGRLFLTTKSLLERVMLPDKYFNSEWGVGLPIVNRGQYIAAANNGLVACLGMVEKNVNLTKGMLVVNEDFTFFSMIIYKILDLVGVKDIAGDRAKKLSGVRKINENVNEFNSALPLLKSTAEDVIKLTGEEKKEKGEKKKKSKK